MEKKESNVPVWIVLLILLFVLGHVPVTIYYSFKYSDECKELGYDYADIDIFYRPTCELRPLPFALLKDAQKNKKIHSTKF